MKPKLFIASSVEGLNIAEAIQTQLDYVAEVTIWSQSVFTLSSNTIDDLLLQTKQNEYGIFVFSSDDETKIRNQSVNAIRDNVLFELGLFMGALGKERAFFIKPKGINIHIPSDLMGLNYGEFEPNRSDGNLNAAVGTFCTQVKNRIDALGPNTIFKQIRDIFEKINPIINAHVKNGHHIIGACISQNNHSLLIDIQEKSPHYFDSFIAYQSNGSYNSNNTNSIGNMINDVTPGVPLMGFIFTFKEDYLRKLKV